MKQIDNCSVCITVFLFLCFFKLTQKMTIFCVFRRRKEVIWFWNDLSNCRKYHYGAFFVIFKFDSTNPHSLTLYDTKWVSVNVDRLLLFYFAVLFDFNELFIYLYFIWLFPYNPLRKTHDLATPMVNPSDPPLHWMPLRSYKETPPIDLYKPAQRVCF